MTGHPIAQSQSQSQGLAAAAATTAQAAPTLFISYDGLLDPLGSSQILPYVLSLSRHPRPMHILSFEKRERFKAGEESLREYLEAQGISWTPLPFTTRGGKAGKGWDLLRMYTTALSLCQRYRIRTVHCRSYQAMQVGCLLRRLFKVRAIFDMRGLWVDERVDGGLWPQARWTNRLAYFTYKKIERSLLACASHVVALTTAVVPELHRLAPGMTAQVTVIPCCADYEHFVPLDMAAKQHSRATLGIPGEALVLSYLGSLGTWYMLEEMLQFFARAATQREDVHMLFITRDWSEAHEALLHRMGLQGLRARIHVHAAARSEVPAFLGASDIMLSFIKPAYSKLASSPTKLAEAFALGIPVISNSGVGDVAAITERLDAGAVFDVSKPGALDVTVETLDEIRDKGGERLRQESRPYFGLEVAAAAYERVYACLEQPT